MASCYRCGRVLSPQERRQRRQVYTGESFWVLRARRRQSSHRTHYGMRIVCGACATQLDWNKGVNKSATGRAKEVLTIVVGVALLLLGLLFATYLLGR